MVKRYCRTDREVRAILVRVAHQKIERPIIVLVCVACNLAQASSVPVVLMDGNIYCVSDALKKAKLNEPQLTEAEFRSRLQPYAGVSQLRRYPSTLACPECRFAA